MLRTLFSNEFFEGSKRGDGELRARKPDGGEGRMSEVSEGDIVKANQGNITGNVEAGIANGAERANGREIIGSDYSGGRLRQPEKIAHRKYATFNAMIAFFDEFG